MLAVVLVVLGSVGVYGLPMAAAVPGISATELARLLEGGTLVFDAGSVDRLRLVPAIAEGDSIRTTIRAKLSGLLIETAYLVKSARFDSGERLAAYNALNTVSSLSGITYFSETRQKTSVLFSDVYRVPAPGSRKAIPDVTSPLIPERTHFDIHIRDINFGSTWYSVSVDAEGTGISLTLSNSKPLGLPLVDAFGTGGLRLLFTMVPVDEGILVYGVCAADPTKLAIRMVDMYSAVEKRLNAVRLWVVGRIGKVIK
jgi:hypothetical protein